MLRYSVNSQDELDEILETRSKVEPCTLTFEGRGERFLVRSDDPKMPPLHLKMSQENFLGVKGLGITVQCSRGLVDVNGPIRVFAHGASIVHATGAFVRAAEYSRVSVLNDSTVVATSNASVYTTLGAKAKVIASDSTVVHACDDTVIAYDECIVHAYSMDAVICAFGSSHIRHYSRSYLYVGSPQVSVVTAHPETIANPGEGVIIPLKDIRFLTEGATIEEWCNVRGVPHDGTFATMYKAVSSDLAAGEDYRRIHYPIGERVFAPDWDPDPYCGRGLHVSPTPQHGAAYRDLKNFELSGRFLEVRVPLDSLIPLGRGKAKAPWVDVVREVNWTMEPVRGEESAE